MTYIPVVRRQTSSTLLVNDGCLFDEDGGIDVPYPADVNERPPIDPGGAVDVELPAGADPIFSLKRPSNDAGRYFRLSATVFGAPDTLLTAAATSPVLHP